MNKINKILQRGILVLILIYGLLFVAKGSRDVSYNVRLAENISCIEVGDPVPSSCDLMKFITERSQSNKAFKEFIERASAAETRVAHAVSISIKHAPHLLDNIPAMEKLAKDLEESVALQAFLNSKERLKAWEDALTGGLNALRKDVNYLETLSPYSAGTLSRKFPSIGINEEGLIRHYTGPSHGPLNQALESGGSLTDDLLEFKNTLNSGLNKLPNHTGQVYRGLGSTESAKALNWNVGQTVTESKFISTTKSADVAEDFMLQGGGNVRLVVQSKTGKLIETASFKPLEQEVLFGTGKQFEVLNKYPFPLDDGTVITEIVLKEL